MKYSFHCKKCGHTVMSDDKEAVKAAKQMHKARIIEGPAGMPMAVPKCLLMESDNRKLHTKKVARPSLAKVLRKERGIKTDG